MEGCRKDRAIEAGCP